MYWLCPAEVFWVTLGVVEFAALTGEHGVDGGDNSNIRAKVAIVADSDLSVVLDGEVEICEKPLAYLCMLAVVESNRPLDASALSELGYDIDKKKITVKEAMKSVGVYEAEIRFMENVAAKIKVKVLPL